MPEPAQTTPAASWRFSAPISVAELIALLEAEDARAGTALLVGGGQSLVPGFRAGRYAPAHLIDVMRIEPLRRIVIKPEGARIGAAATFSDLLRSDVAQGWPVLAEALRHVGTVPIRNRTSVGGNLAWAEPRAEWPLMIKAFNARIHTNLRVIAGIDFAIGANRTALRANEVILEVELPPLHHPMAFAETMGRNSAGRGVVLVAVARNDNLIRVTVGGLVDRAVMSPWLSLDESRSWLDAEVARFSVLADPFHSLSYRMAVAKSLIARCAERTR
ncbi:MAG: FAD binding domain-containing protein [Sphingomonadales bacterium]|nr:FAD binding domain-containing protein [Sphingomonadales bacterium]